MTPYHFMPVRFRLPESRHPIQPAGLGFVIDVVTDNRVRVATLPNPGAGIASGETVTVPERGKQPESEGWYEPVKVPVDPETKAGIIDEVKREILADLRSKK